MPLSPLAQTPLAQTPLAQTQVAGATEVRNHFGRILNQVFRSQEPLIVEKGGIPVAALISMAEYEQFRRWQATQAGAPAPANGDAR